MERIGPWLQTHWDYRAAGNFIGGGTGSGLAVVAAPMALSGSAVGWAPFLVSAACIAAGLSLVWLEIGRPWRFLHVFYHPQTSWMTREALIAPPLLSALCAAALFGGAVAQIAAGVLGLAFLYSQSRILRASTGIPAWREAWVVPLIVSTGVAEGAGLYLVLAAMGTPLVLAGTAVLVAARWLAWRAYANRLTRGPAPAGARASLRRIETPFTVGSTLAPIVLLTLALTWPEASIVFAPLAGLASIAGGWLLKATIVTRAAFNQGFALPRLPLRPGDPRGSEIAARSGWN